MKELGLDAKEVLFVAGSGFDLIGTSKVGLDTYWHNRVGLQRPAAAPPPMRESRSLDGLGDYSKDERRTFSIDRGPGSVTARRRPRRMTSCVQE